MIVIDNEKKETTKVTFNREENLGVIGTLKVTERLQKIIDYLHYKIGATEWSGILFYKLTKGDIKTLKNLEFTADFLYPMNIGNSTYTEFEYNGDVIDAYDIYPEGIEMSTALIHSHHNMGTFFSTTDSSELKDNAAHYNYYVSLIVNFAHEYCAKVAFPSKTTVTSESWIKDTFGKLFKRKSTKEENTILIGDLKVIIESNIENPEWLKNRIQGLETKKKQAVVIKQPSEVSQKTLFDDKYDFDRTLPSYNWLPKEKKEFVSKSKQFLSALIFQDSTKTNGNIHEGLKILSDLDDAELVIFAESLDQNLEIIHENIYNSTLGSDLKKHCLEAMLELVGYENSFGETDGYQSLTETLGLYAI